MRDLTQWAWPGPCWCCLDEAKEGVACDVPRGWLRGLGANNKLVCREVALLVLHGANVLHQAPCLENHLCILNILKINTLYPPKCS